MKKAVSLITIIMLFAAVISYACKNLLVHGQVPADAVQSNPLSISWAYPIHVSGETFSVYVDVVNVAELLAWQCGFRFDQTALQVVTITVGSAFSNPNIWWVTPGEIDNINGIVHAWTCTATNPIYAISGTGHLLVIDMQINPTLFPPYSGNYPGTPVPMIDLTDANGDPCELMLFYSDGVTEITPTPDHIYDGSFKLSVTTDPFIPGDVNRDGVVNVMDATEVGMYWLQTVPPAPPNVDINEDGTVNVMDSTIISLHWLEHIIYDP